MTKKQLEDKIIELNSKIFDLERAVSKEQMFVQAGEERLEKAMKRIDQYILQIKKLKQ